MTTKSGVNKNSSFVRWQGRSIQALGKVISLLLTLSLATIGFIISKVLEQHFSFASLSAKRFVVTGGFTLSVAVIFFLFITYNRLLAFKLTTQIARKREKNDLTNIEQLRASVKKLDRRTWAFLKFAISLFAFGEALVTVGFIIEVINR
jgi:hypothetical protein